MLKPRFGKVTALVLALLFAWFVWPTRFRYFEYRHGLPMREDRFTGQVRMLAPEEGGYQWIEPGTRTSTGAGATQQVRAPLTDKELLRVVVQGTDDEIAKLTEKEMERAEKLIDDMERAIQAGAKAESP